MIRINVLVENFSINNKYKSKHGLSLFINFNDMNILYDVGPDSTFIKNASVSKIDLNIVEYLFFSHNHYDHVGGINDFCRVNGNSKIYLMDSIKNKYYIKVFCLYIPINIKLDKKNNSRMIETNENIAIDNKIYYIRNTVEKYKKPTFNKMLYKLENKKKINDDFNHEGILVIVENENLHILNLCSHNGILNSIETVKNMFPNKKVKNYVGGLHLYNPPTGKNDSNEYLDYLIGHLKEMDVCVYTGHCTGKYALNYLKNNLEEKIIEINTGMEIIL